MELFKLMKRPCRRDQSAAAERPGVSRHLDSPSQLRAEGCSISCPPGLAIGQLITPRNDNACHSTSLRFERIPGAYHCSKKGTHVIFGLKLVNPPRALAELIEEVNRATPKQVFFFDSGFVLGDDSPYAVNWTDNRGCPTIIPVFVNPNRAVPEIVAHELMHSWIEFYAGLEDGREYVDQSNRALASAVQYIQSMVLDCTVLWQLQRRGGFDLDLFRRDVMADARQNVMPFKSAMMHATPLGQLVTAQALAVPNACPDLYQLTKEDRIELDELWRTCRKYDPAIVRTADRMAEALRHHGYQTESGIRASVDDCLKAAFDFLCVPFNADKDMVWKVVQMAPVDKMPDFMSGCPVDIKHEALRDSIRSRQHILSSAYSPGKDVLVTFAPKGSCFSSLMLPKISRPEEAGEPAHIFFFEGATKQEEMAELQPPESSLPFLPADIYAQTYALSFKPGSTTNLLSSGGDPHVLHA